MEAVGGAAFYRTAGLGTAVPRHLGDAVPPAAGADAASFFGSRWANHSQIIPLRVIASLDRAWVPRLSPPPAIITRRWGFAGVSAALAAAPRRLDGTIAMLACAAKQTSIDPQKARRHRQEFCPPKWDHPGSSF